MTLQQFNLLTQTEILPTQPRDRCVAVRPHVVMESAKVELLFLIQSPIGEELDDLEFANLICDRLAG
jgi:hypothetical protein